MNHAPYANKPENSLISAFKIFVAKSRIIRCTPMAVGKTRIHRLQSVSHGSIFRERITKMKKKLFFAVILIFVWSVSFFAQKKPDELLKYKLLATTKTSTMQKELDKMAALGYRVLVDAPTSGVEMAVFLSLEATPEEPYKYKLLATSRTGTMQKELDEFSVLGYRLVPSTMVAKKQLFGEVEVAMILEQPPKVKNRYEYRLLATSLTSTLQKEVSRATADGFVIVGMVSRDEHMVVMERVIPLVVKMETPRKNGYPSLRAATASPR